MVVLQAIAFFENASKKFIYLDSGGLFSSSVVAGPLRIILFINFLLKMRLVSGLSSEESQGLLVSPLVQRMVLQTAAP